VLPAFVRPGPGVRRLSPPRTLAQAGPESLAWLRRRVEKLLPKIDLPDLLFEVHSWTGFLEAFVHLGDGTTRMKDLATSLVALLVSEACHMGLTPVVNPAHEARTRARLVAVGDAVDFGDRRCEEGISAEETRRPGLSSRLPSRGGARPYMLPPRRPPRPAPGEFPDVPALQGAMIFAGAALVRGGARGRDPSRHLSARNCRCCGG
jgi:Tn3 transposase DDE domain-containing protein